MNDLSILIPSRNEMFLKDTIEDILENREADTDVIAVLDGKWAEPRLEQHPRVNVIYYSKSIGQRASTNRAAELSKAKYVMKIDAHCSFDKGFDRKMVEFMDKVGDDVTSVPIMRNLWAFDWKCYGCGYKQYQDKPFKVCPKCKGVDIRRKKLWIGKHNPQSTSYCFDSEPHFKYFEDYKHRPKYIKDKKELGYTETMSLQGSCFMSTRDKYFELNLCDEKLGNWGNQGIEVALKTWLSGGRVLVNHNTWYAHMFRTKGKDFGFPWEEDAVKNKEITKRQTKNNVKKLFFEDGWSKAKYNVQWLVDKFSPVPGW